MQVHLKRRIQTDWAFATLDELKSRRAEALSNAVQAEGDAVEPRRQTEMYLNAATDLSARAVALQAFAKSHLAKGESEEASRKLAKAEELQALSNRNWALADEKARLLAQLEGRARQQTITAQQLTMEIKSRTASFDENDAPTLSTT
jgi:hypothetical protein